jgi:hypothetical protein
MVRNLLLLPFAFSIGANAATFKSPNNRVEECRALPAIADGDMSKKDLEEEQELCSIDLYSPQVGVCPKTWSTSAGTVLVDLSKMGMSPAAFEASKCGDRKAWESLAKFKTSMNQSGTSGTTSESSWMYYKLSRYLDTLVEVPVAVLRTFDKDVIGSRVARKARGQSAMSRAAWSYILKSASNPAAYVPADDIFTTDRQQFYGVLLDGKGERYGNEINGPRKAAWGAPQSVDFQTPPAFSALRTDAPLNDVVRGAKYPSVQMVYWMRELSEIAVLDHIFSQQDRVGNVDFTWKWYWVDAEGKIQDRKVKSKVGRDKMAQIAVPEDIKAFKPVLLQRTWISDNDAGLSKRYANFAKRTGMVANLRHFNAKTYKLLQALARDLQAGGPLAQHLKRDFGMKDSQFKLLSDNTIEVASILRNNCAAGKLRFDLNQSAFMKGQPALEKIGCDGN